MINDFKTISFQQTSFYKSLAEYLISKESTFKSSLDASTSGSNTDFIPFAFYPVQAPAHAKFPFCVFKIMDNETDNNYDGNFHSGRARIQFDIASPNLELTDRITELIKDEFVSQKIILNNNYSIATSESGNEFDAFDDEVNLWLRSIDLRIRYIKQ